MPMPTKGARLFLRKRKGREPVYVIKDTGNVERSTGTDDRRQAEIQLSDHIAQKTRSGGSARPEAVSIAEVLAIYGEEHAPTVASPRSQGLAIAALLPFWGAKMVSEVKGETCRRYAKTRKHHQTGLPIAPGTIRRELTRSAPR